MFSRVHKSMHIFYMRIIANTKKKFTSKSVSYQRTIIIIIYVGRTNEREQKEQEHPKGIDRFLGNE